MRKYFNNFKGILAIVFSLSLVLTAIFFQTQSAQAEEPVALGFSASIVSLPGESLTPQGYLNSNNTGFRLNFNTTPDFQFYEAGMFIDDSLVPTDNAIFDQSESYYLSSNTSTLNALKTLLPQDTHQITLKFKSEKTSLFKEAWSANLVCDYALPSGLFSATPSITKEVLAVGDTIDLKFQPDAQSLDTSSVKATIYGRELTWQKVENPTGNDYFTATYTVLAGDTNQSEFLPLSGVKIQDKAGNVSSLSAPNVPISFAIDTTAPTLLMSLNSLSGQIEQGDKISLEGISEPETAIIAEVSSDPITFQTITDLDGKWRIEIDTAKLDIGQHHLKVTAINSLGNKTTIDLGGFELIAKRVAVLETAPVKLALQTKPSNRVARSDVPAQVVQTAPVVTNNEEVASQGKLGSADQTSNVGINWSAWILVLAMVVLASALATAGYYGYGWIALRQANLSQAERVSQTSKKEPPRDAPNKSDASPKDKDTESPKTRW